MISIIIPTFNRAAWLKETLQSLVRQSYPVDRYEILIVDNGSTDVTGRVAGGAIAAHPSHRIRYLIEPQPGLLSGRHRGALETKGDILTFVDDDIEADAHWLRAIDEAFADPSVQLVGGRNLPRFEKEPPEWLHWFWTECPYGRYYGYLSLIDFGNQARDIDASYVWGLNFSIRRKALLELGGFHPDNVPLYLQHFQGDGETGVTLNAEERGYKATYHPGALVYHQISGARMTPEYFEKRQFYQGLCDSYAAIRKHKAVAPPQSWADLIPAFCPFPGEEAPRKSRRPPVKKVLDKRFQKAFCEGFQFHQNAVRRNPDLLRWVLKEDYWDYALPTLARS